MNHDWICEWRHSRSGYNSITPIQLTAHWGPGWVALTFVLLGVDATWRYAIGVPEESLGRDS
jgi:hypothetical protein